MIYVYEAKIRTYPVASTPAVTGSAVIQTMFDSVCIKATENRYNYNTNLMVDMDALAILNCTLRIFTDFITVAPCFHITKPHVLMVHGKY